jgi:LysM repeat protein
MNRLIFALIACLCFVLPPVLSTAQDVVIEHKDSGDFFVHRVEKGHTLYSISKLYDVSIDVVTAANPEAGLGLSIGQTLYIPVPGSFKSDEFTNPIRIEKGEMVHRVLRKETLYGIAKKYDADMNSLLERNPKLNEGLSIGMEIYIPFNDVDQSVAVQLKPEAADSLQKHTVEPGETLYSISKRFGFTITDILAVNNGLPEGLKAGGEICLPQKDEYFAIKTEPIQYTLTLRDTIFIKERYHVAILLPFILNAPLEGLEGSKDQRLREIALSFYRGCRMALDTLEKRGANLEVHIYDVSNDTPELDALLASAEFKNIDLIIGPLQKKSLDKVAKFASVKGIHVVCPTLTKNNILLTSPNVSKVHSSEATQMKLMAQYVARHHSGENVILINSKEINDTRNVQLFKRHYNDALRSLPDSSNRALIELEASSRFVGDLNAKLSKARRNILVVPAGRESRSMIANLQTKLQLIDSEQFQIVIYGMSEWMDFDFLDIEFKNKVELRIPESSFVDFEDPKVLNFTAAFRKKYQTDPDKYAFLGYDVTLFYGQGLKQFGINFPNHFDHIATLGLMHVNFNYVKTGVETGYENEHVVLLKHHQFALETISSND